MTDLKHVTLRVMPIFNIQLKSGSNQYVADGRVRLPLRTNYGSTSNADSTLQLLKSKTAFQAANLNHRPNSDFQVRPNHPRAVK